MFEHYHVKLLETTLRIYYISSLGKIGYVQRSELTANKRMDEKLIHWCDGKTIYRGKIPKYVVVVNSTKYTVKNLIAKHFIKDYVPSKHIVYHRDRNYLNCSVENLVLGDRQKIYRKYGKYISNKPIEVRKVGEKEWRYFESLTDAAKAMFVYVDTLANYLNRKTRNSILLEYDFRVDGVKFVPRKRTGANYKVKLSLGKENL